MRDITRNPEWEAAYSIAIPVLSHAALDGSHEVSMLMICRIWHVAPSNGLDNVTIGRLLVAMQRRIPRPAPRISADRLERHIVEALGGNS